MVWPLQTPTRDLAFVETARHRVQSTPSLCSRRLSTYVPHPFSLPLALVTGFKVNRITARFAQTHSIVLLAPRRAVPLVATGANAPVVILNWKLLLTLFSSGHLVLQAAQVDLVTSSASTLYNNLVTL